MQVHKPTLHPLARAALMELQAAGVEITPEIVLWVQDAAAQIRKQPLRPVADLVDWPTSVGGVFLYPLTFGAVAWLKRMPPKQQNNPEWLAFACAHARDPKTFEDNQTYQQAAGLVFTWIRRLSCSRDALVVALDRCLGLETYEELPDGPRQKAETNPWDWGAFVCALCAKYPGTSPEYWTWKVSREKAVAMLQGVNAELPESHKVSEYEMETNIKFRAVVEHIKAEAHHG